MIPFMYGAKTSQDHSRNIPGGLRSGFDEGGSRKNWEKLQEPLGCAEFGRMQTQRRNWISPSSDYLFEQIFLQWFQDTSIKVIVKELRKMHEQIIRYINSKVLDSKQRQSRAIRGLLPIFESILIQIKRHQFRKDHNRMKKIISIFECGIRWDQVGIQIQRSATIGSYLQNP